MGWDKRIIDWPTMPFTCQGVRQHCWWMGYTPGCGETWVNQDLTGGVTWGRHRVLLKLLCWRNSIWYISIYSNICRNMRCICMKPASNWVVMFNNLCLQKIQRSGSTLCLKSTGVTHFLPHIFYKTCTELWFHIPRYTNYQKLMP